MLCMMAAIAIVSPLNAQDIVKVKQLTTEAESQVANGQWDEAIATLNTIRNIMGSLEGKPKELYNQAQEGKRREEQEAKNQENKVRFNALVQEGDDLYDLGYYQKALDKYLEAKDLFETDDLNQKIARVSQLVSENLAEYYENKAREYESDGYINTALEYYLKAQDAKFSESRARRIKEIKDKLNGYYKSIEDGNQAYLNADYRKALWHFIKASNTFTSDDVRSMIPQSTFMVRIHEFDSVLAKNNVRQATRILDTLEFLNSKFQSYFRDPADMQCFLYAAQTYLGNAKSLKYLNTLYEETEIKALDIFLKELDSIDGYANYGANCDQSSENEIWAKFREKNALSNSPISKLDLDNFIWNYYVRAYFGKSKKEITSGHFKSLHYILEYTSLMYTYQKSVNDYWYYDIEATDDDYPGMYEIESIKKERVDYQWDSTLNVFNIGVKQLIDKGLYDSAQHELDKLLDYVYFFKGDTSISSLTSNYLYKWALSERFPKYEYVKYMFKHPAFVVSYKLYKNIEALKRARNSKWAIDIKVPVALGAVAIADRSVYDYTYTTNQSPFAFQETGTSDRELDYKSPTRMLQARVSLNSVYGKSRKALLVQWNADVQWMMGINATSAWKTYTPRAEGSTVPPAGTVLSVQNNQSNLNGYQLLLFGVNPSIRVYKWVKVVVGLDRINLNYNGNFSAAKSESPTNFNLKQTKPVLGFSIELPTIYKNKWGAHMHYLNYSSVFNSSSNLIAELPLDEQRSTGLLTLNPMAYRLTSGIRGDFEDWSLSLDYDMFKSHFNYANAGVPLSNYRFKGMSWNLFTVSLIKRM